MSQVSRGITLRRLVSEIDHQNKKTKVNSLKFKDAISVTNETKRCKDQYIFIIFVIKIKCEYRI